MRSSFLFVSLQEDNADDASPPPPVSHAKSLLIEMGFSSSLVHRTIDENGIHKGMPMDEMLNFLAAAQLDEKYSQDSQQHLSDLVVLPPEVRCTTYLYSS